eukprot:gene5559-6922_t
MSTPQTGIYKFNVQFTQNFIDTLDHNETCNFVNTTKNDNTKYFADAYIRDVLEDLQYYKPGISRGCAEILSTYLCTYGFILDSFLPCNTTCDVVNQVCPPDLKFNDQILFPGQETCSKGGVSECKPPCCSSFVTVGYLEWFKNLTRSSTADIYPGGKAKGTVLGFGILVALLLMILGLGFIMKQQNKK